MQLVTMGAQLLPGHKVEPPEPESKTSTSPVLTSGKEPKPRSAEGPGEGAGRQGTCSQLWRNLACRRPSNCEYTLITHKGQYQPQSRQ